MSAGNLITRRKLVVGLDGTYLPGQHQARIIDPHPHRDRADLAAILTYVDDQQRACSVTCMRYRDERGWRSISVHRATPKKIERGTAVGCPPLQGELLAVVEQAAAYFIAEGREPFPFQEPSEDERKMRALAHHLMDQVEAER
jgi:hypothetical protein